MHLTYKKHCNLSVSKNGRAFLENLTPVDQFDQLFKYYKNRFNWAYYTFFDNDARFAEALQSSQDIIWRLVKEKGTRWQDYESFCDNLNERLNLQAFLDKPYSAPEKVLYQDVKYILFDKLLSLFGCVELETKEINKWSTAIIRFRLTKIGLAIL